MAIGLWARVSPALDHDGWFSPDALMLHLKARFNPGAGTTPGHYRIRLEEDVYSVHVGETAIRIVHGESGDAETTIQSDLATLTKVIKRRETPAHAIKSGRLLITGNRRAASLLLTGK